MVQEQWRNISLLNYNETSIYTILYFASGLLVPLIILLISNNNFLYYQYQKYSIDQKSKKVRNLFYPLIIILFLLSLLISKYTILLLQLINQVFPLKFSNQINLEIYTIFIIAFLLLFKKSKIFVKRFFLFNYFILSVLIWSYYSIGFPSSFSDNYNFFLFTFNLHSNNIFTLNILYLFIVEVVYYIWSYISFKNNISDWCVPFPSINDLVPIIKIFKYYSSFFTYYFILGLLLK